MTDATAAVDTAAVAKKIDPAQSPADSVDSELVARLVEQARAAGVQLTGDGGLLQQLTKRVLESALDGELTDHLGYDKGDAEAKTGANHRNGSRAKTVLTEVGPVEIDVPRDRDGSLSPQIARPPPANPKSTQLGIIGGGRPTSPQPPATATSPHHEVRLEYYGVAGQAAWKRTRVTAASRFACRCQQNVTLASILLEPAAVGGPAQAARSAGG